MRVSDLITQLQLLDPDAQVVMRDGSDVARVHILTPVLLRAFERKGERWLECWGTPLTPHDERTTVYGPVPGVVLE